jgi:hypothetical protein
MEKRSIVPRKVTERESIIISNFFVGEAGEQPPPITALQSNHEQAKEAVEHAIKARNSSDMPYYEVMPDDISQADRDALFARILPRKTPSTFEYKGRVLYDNMKKFDEQRRQDRKKRIEVAYTVTWCISCVFLKKRLWFFGIKSDCGRSFPLLTTTGTVGSWKSYSPRLFCEFLDHFASESETDSDSDSLHAL